MTHGGMDTATSELFGVRDNAVLIRDGIVAARAPEDKATRVRVRSFMAVQRTMHGMVVRPSQDRKTDGDCVHYRLKCASLFLSGNRLIA